MVPVHSYRIWFTPRTGSTLLCKGLESTAIAGQPGEHFNTDSLIKHYKTDQYHDFKNQLWQLGTSPNGVLGIKHSMFQKRYKAIFSELLKMRNIENSLELNHDNIWSDLFPNCQHIFLTRRNKIRQAVSWWKAIKDEVWHLNSTDNQKETDAFYEEHYNFDALLHLLKEANLRECAIQDYFEKYQIQALTLVYEDFIQNFEESILSILRYLNLDTKESTVGEMFYKKTATDRSEKWVQRFRKDLQAQMEHPTW